MQFLLLEEIHAANPVWSSVPNWIFEKIWSGYTCVQVPPSVPASKGLKAIQLKKADEFFLEMRDPLPLGTLPGERPMSPSRNETDEVSRIRKDDGPPSYVEAMNDSCLAGHQRSDSDLARELHAKLNAE